MNLLPQLQPLTVILIAFVGAALIAMAGGHRWLREGLSWLASILFFLAVMGLLGAFLAGESVSQSVWEIMPGLTIAFRLEPVGMLFAAMSSTLWVLATPYAIGYMNAKGYSNLGRFFACYAIALGAAAGIAFADNLFTLFVFYEILSVSTYPLVAHSGDERSRKGARTYIALLLATSIGLMLPAMIWVWSAAGTLDFAPGGILDGQVSPWAGALMLMLFMYGAGKAALMPFHRWLPAAMVAPTPVSALLHAVAVVKAGVFVVLKIALYIFGLDYLRELATSDVVLYIAAFTMLAASLVAISRDNLKARLAYSTVSQLSYIVVGAMLAVQLAAIGGGLHMLMHGFGKITLFFCAGAIYVASGKTQVSELDGLGRRMPWTFAAFLVGALCVIGLPPTGGLWSKWHLVMGAWESGHGIIMLAFLLSTLLNIGYLLPPVLRAFLRPLPDGEPAGVREAPWMCVVPLVLTALGTIVLFLGAGPVFRLLETLFLPGA
ncbi:monovalent cation/H+ antiporter subunit D family protein [Wenzhouxiangella sp. AB-CW3]|uniref:proton-conducting transporter transmembrane domain-containing protein n=1 Tax=Wenzhouxiangella sp. AB-CW3 TaxID=2771012 RepID=UPI00168ACD2C|nr:proton-conducting transporter membrane subunit [Wenzhouxiangella sp. AB-CW3]QOC22157.1 monovalent cation/H+ antiporter subunit D family protein [Wenzhouxiangella sp. AB-CW3]